MSNMGLYKAFEAEGINYEQTAVGDKYVAENMLENNYGISIQFSLRFQEFTADIQDLVSINDISLMV